MTLPPLADPWSWQPPRPSRWEQPVSLIRLDGPDTRRFLHGQSSQDLERAQPGQCLATCCLTPTARVRGLADVLVDEHGAWMVITAGDGAAIRQALDRVLFPADAVTLGPVTPARLITVEGAEAIPDLPAAGDAGGGGRWLPGARLLLRAEDACPPWLEALPVLGAPEAERWRLSQGRPAAPAEINDEVNPFELGLADRVSLNKGCYVGQETLAKLATYDGVKQQLRRWVWTAQDPGAEPERMLLPGAPLTTAAGERAGRISSVLALPADGGQPARWIGLALVRRGVLESDTLLAGAGFPLRISLPDGFQPPPGSGSGR